MNRTRGKKILKMKKIPKMKRILKMKKTLVVLPMQNRFILIVFPLEVLKLTVVRKRKKPMRNVWMNEFVATDVFLITYSMDNHARIT